MGSNSMDIPNRGEIVSRHARDRLRDALSGGRETFGTAPETSDDGPFVNCRPSSAGGAGQSISPWGTISTDDYGQAVLLSPTDQFAAAFEIGTTTRPGGVTER
jgi:hypothetical protein